MYGRRSGGGGGGGAYRSTNVYRTRNANYAIFGSTGYRPGYSPGYTTRAKARAGTAYSAPTSQSYNGYYQRKRYSNNGNNEANTKSSGYKVQQQNKARGNEYYQSKARRNEYYNRKPKPNYVSNKSSRQEQRENYATGQRENYATGQRENYATEQSAKYRGSNHTYKKKTVNQTINVDQQQQQQQQRPSRWGRMMGAMRMPMMFMFFSRIMRPSHQEQQPPFPPIHQEQQSPFPPFHQEQSPPFSPIHQEQQLFSPPIHQEQSPPFSPIHQEQQPAFPPIHQEQEQQPPPPPPKEQHTVNNTTRARYPATTSNDHVSVLSDIPSVMNTGSDLLDKARKPASKTKSTEINTGKTADSVHIGSFPMDIIGRVPIARNTIDDITAEDFKSKSPPTHDEPNAVETETQSFSKDSADLSGALSKSPYSIYTGLLDLSPQRTYTLQEL
ncbi:hypothetical protein KGF56_001166 [Candida oxycetoniae]|uniref:Uncharacterized protein n=1 Tax=Candida oxycetoniae TaxID=497107 RepID=A0AAI9WZ30_9ASCO|nr:uncharacterized protein KGF56_001166 [Candida oxycetoniae]KAI3405947.2 hypothetical protein KGF56_001166 [Candida oxycetoniae]